MISLWPLYIQWCQENSACLIQANHTPFISTYSDNRQLLLCPSHFVCYASMIINKAPILYGVTTATFMEPFPVFAIKARKLLTLHQSCLNIQLDMNFLSTSSNKSNCQQPIVPYSSSESRANLMSFGGQPTRRRKRSKSKSRRPSSQGKRTKSRVTKVRLVKGKVALRIRGYPGVTRLGASQLVKFVPLNKLKIAAKRALGSVKKPQHRRRRRRHNHHKRRQQNPSI